MMKEQEEEEFITVRVQDPRIQDQSSWSSYVDYNIFLYTNSKAFTVKTSCVRRRYREFVWLRRRLQKNAGLVPLPELPGKKPFFQVNDSEGIERRRQGLQQFLENIWMILRKPHLLPTPGRENQPCNMDWSRVQARLGFSIRRSFCLTVSCTSSCKRSCPQRRLSLVFRAILPSLSMKPSWNTPCAGRAFCPERMLGLSATSVKGNRWLLTLSHSGE
ncbi:uncharacterized protein [Scyliorhinus torazame]|uniref:uncharacterized protein isoform X2 n=1 Tax=Scyliorhinus torazame TaxID=75743 RepID=UPI003B5CF696